MLEAGQHPRAIDRDHTEKYLASQKVRAELMPVEAGLVDWSAGRPLSCASEEATQMAERMLSLVTTVEAQLAEADVEQLEQPRDQWDEQELQQLRDLLNKAQPIRPKLADVRYIAAALRGQHRLKPAQRQTLGALMQQYANNLKLGLDESVERFVERELDNHLVSPIANPSGFMVWQRYVTKIERAIERKTSLLRRR